MQIDYNLLWSELEDGNEVDNKTWKEFETISHREKNIDESAFRIHKGRLDEAYAEVLKARGLKNERQTEQANTAT